MTPSGVLWIPQLLRYSYLHLHLLPLPHSSQQLDSTSHIQHQLRFLWRHRLSPLNPLLSQRTPQRQSRGHTRTLRVLVALYTVQIQCIQGLLCTPMMECTTREHSPRAPLRCTLKG